MSPIDRPEDRVTLQPVTCWPLIWGSIGFVVLALLLVASVALWSVLQPRPERVAKTSEKPIVDSTPVVVELPPTPVAFRPQKQVIVKLVGEDYYAPLPKLKVPPPTASQLRESLHTTIAVPVVEEKKPVQKPKPTILSLRAGQDEATLRKSLASITREIDIRNDKTDVNKFLEESKKHLEARVMVKKGEKKPDRTQTIRDLIAKRDDLRGLPIVAEELCETSADAARTMGLISREARSAVSGFRGRTSMSEDSEHIQKEEAMIIHLRSEAKSGSKVVAGLKQIYQVENETVRLELVSVLAKIKGSEATEALAQRAIYDLSSKVRASAISALKSRPVEDARSVLLEAMRHPWPAVANHAAYALEELKDTKAIPKLEKMLDLPSPTEPFKEDSKWVVREVVRVNHLRNCALCHAAALEKSVIPAPVPTPGVALPVVYYSSRRRGTTPFVQAEIVYLRQDFSIMAPVIPPEKWPLEQRFDYLVRKRPLSNKEIEAYEIARSAKKGKADRYPQAEAVTDLLAALKRKPD